MYITTFYSFKGGVGRTMALVNTAVNLALRGRRVLVVDFDIEAPGLDTFEVLNPQKEVPGLINFVADYVNSGKSPDVTDYIGDCPDIGKEGGRLWIMPSGKNNTYTATLGQINWVNLYKYQDGYVLFEDLREQWLKVLHPDYVLIDSRTGYTDSSGICTRQLPDSVVILFFPNEQNLRGLTQVVRNIRAEADGPREKSIALHFIMSNVPDLDDEHLILKGKISAFKQELDLKHDPMVVHRYDSLSLLNQAVFSKDRPSSRLAKEYSHLVQEIITQNWKDRTGALEYIRRAKRHRIWLDDGSILTREQTLEKIKRSHPEDGEILYRLATLKDADRESEAAEQLINQAISYGCDQPEAYLMRSRFRKDSGERIGAAEDAWQVLDSSRISPQMIHEAARILLKIGKSNPEKLIKSKAVLSLEPNEKFWLAQTYDRSRNHLLIAVALYEPIVALPDLSARIRSASNSKLGMAYMGLGRCIEAARLFRKPNSNIADMDLDNAFNYGMACWGIDGKAHREIFECVIKIDQSSNEVNNSANYFQCMSIAYWATDEIGLALDNINKSQELIIRRGLLSEFSCWQYLEVDAETFASDLNEIRDMIEKNEIQNPRFLIEADTIDKK